MEIKRTGAESKITRAAGKLGQSESGTWRERSPLTKFSFRVYSGTRRIVSLLRVAVKMKTVLSTRTGLNSLVFSESLKNPVSWSDNSGWNFQIIFHRLVVTFQVTRFCILLGSSDDHWIFVIYNYMNL